MQIEPNNPSCGNGPEDSQSCAGLPPGSSRSDCLNRGRLEPSDPALQLRGDQDSNAESSQARADRVEALRASIAAGTYHVAGRDVARKMLESLST